MKALVLRAADARSNYREILEEARRGGQELALRHVIYLGEDSWDRMIANGTEAGAGPPDCHDVTNIQYTSGTTGIAQRRAADASQPAEQRAASFRTGLRLTEQDRICVPVPMYHCFGCVTGTHGVGCFGSGDDSAGAHFRPARHHAGDSSRSRDVHLRRPHHVHRAAQHPEFSRFDFSSLRTGVMAGAPCPIEVMNRVVNDMHCPQMTIMYGQTESLADDHHGVRRRSGRTPRLHGRDACPETEIKIVSAGRRDVPVGEQGELCARGYAMMKGYDQDPEATARAVDREGWLHTGDLATMRPDGYFRITGRLKDMIIRGGENIYPREVEEFLYTHPKIADVQVVGLAG